MLSYGAISELPLASVRDMEGLPFGGGAVVSVAASGTPSLIRSGSGSASISATAIGVMRVVVLASGSAVVTVSAAGTSDFVLYAATRNFISRAADQISNTPFYGTLQQTIQFDQSIITGSGFGDITIAWGEITLINSDGAYDEVIRKYAADGRRLQLKVGDERRINSTGYNGFHTVFDGVATGIHVEESVMRVYLRDRTYQLEVPVLPSVYGGTGGADGTADNKGQRKPRAFGYCHNVTPALIDGAYNVFQVNDGPVENIEQVYVRGVPLTFYLNHYDLGGMLGGFSPPPGQYTTCNALGLLRVNDFDGPVTVDVRGDNLGGFVATSADIVKRLLAGFSLDTNSFTRVNALQPALVGYYVGPDSNATIADVIADIMGGIGGYGGFQRDGRQFSVGLFRAPSGVPSATYTRVDIIEIKREQLPNGISPPPYRYRVAWGRNYTPQTETDLAGSVASTRVAYLAEPYRTSEATSAAIRVDHPLAQDPEVVQAYFENEADAAAEAARLLQLYGSSSYSLYRIVLKSKPFVHRVGDVIRVTYPRWDLTTGRLLTIVSVSEKIEANEVEIVGFG